MAPERSVGRFEADTIEYMRGVVPTEVIDDLQRRYRRAQGYNDEPMQGFGPAQTATRTMSARVDRLGDAPFYRLQLEVGPSAGGKPIEGRVVFLLHHTLPGYVRMVEAEEGRAWLEVITSGSFVAGAYLVAEGVRLSIDLAKLPGVPQDFRDN